MILSPTQITQTRDHAFHNFLGFSTACLDAGQRMTELMVDASRETLKQHEEQASDITCVTTASPWLDGARASHFLESVYEIAGDTHKAAINAAQAQMRAFDAAIIAGIEHTRRFSPWEAELALSAMRVTLEGAEHSMNDASQAALAAVDLVEKEVQQISESFTEDTPKARNKANKR